MFYLKTDIKVGASPLKVTAHLPHIQTSIQSSDLFYGWLNSNRLKLMSAVDIALFLLFNQTRSVDFFQRLTK